MTDGLASLIREALAREDYGAALRWWDIYAGELREAVAGGTATEEEMRGLRECCEESRAVLAGARARLQQEANALRAARAYGENRLSKR